MSVQPAADLSQLAGLERVASMELPRSNHHYICLTYLHAWLRRAFAAHAGGRLLDMGCGGQPYRDLIDRHCDEYVGADVAAAAGVDLDLEIRPGEPLDVPDASFDTVLSTQVLEHVPEPLEYLREAARVLRPGGKLLISVPMQWRQHEEPFDFWRFTRYGLEDLLAKSGLEVVAMEPAGGPFAMLGQAFLCFVVDGKGIQVPWIFSVLNWIFLKLDAAFPDDRETLLWMCVARRPPGRGEDE